MPWAPLLPLLTLLPFMLSGAVRYTYGSSMVVSLALPSGVFVVLAGLVYVYGLPRIEQAETAAAVPAVALSAMLLIALCYELWWTPLFAGLPNTFEGVDVGNHLLFFQRFLKPGEHRQYAGFVSMYGLMEWYRRLLGSELSTGPSLWHALRFTHYAFLLSVPVALALVVYPALARVRNGIEATIAAVFSLPLQCAALGCLLFPALQYYQAEGFYSQIAGLYPLLFGWLCYGLIEHAGTRFVLCCVWVGVQRFTYGLNLGDTLLALSYLWLFEAHTIRPAWLRWAAWAFVPVSAYGAVRVLSRLWPLRYSKGYFIEYSLAWVVPSTLLIALLLLVAPSFLRSSGITVAAASERLWRYAGLHGLITGALMAIYIAVGAPVRYYIEKYALYSSVLLSIAALGPLCTLVVHLVTGPVSWLLQPKNAQLLSSALALAALTLFGQVKGYGVYRWQARERWHRSAPSGALYSHYEPRIQAFIEKTLQEKKAGFGGYYDTFWPRMFTHNTFYFFFSHARDYFFNHDFEVGNTMFLEDPGHCYFVLGQPSDYLPGPKSDMGRQLTRLYAKRDGCTSYKPDWSATPLTVCAACL
jgi:hypothetical protein